MFLKAHSFPNVLHTSLLALQLFVAVQTLSSDFRSEHISVEQGLSQSSAWSIIQDRKGFLWIGTADGLNKYDGYSFRIFRNDPADSSSLSNNTVWSLCEDRNGMIWVGTVAGVHRYDPNTEKFSRLADRAKYAGTYLETLTNGILEDHLGVLWFSTIKGIATLDPSSGVLRQFTSEEIPPSHSLPIFRILHEDEFGDVWLANGEYLFRYERSSQRIIRVLIGQQKERMAFLRSAKAHNGTVWFATNFHGLWSYNPKSGEWDSYRHDSRDRASLVDDRLRTVCEDADGRIWVGTVYDGLSYFDSATRTFSTYSPSDGGGKDARFEGVTAIICDRSRLLWIGYDGAGLLKLNPYRNKFRHVLLPPSDVRASGDNFFKSLAVDHRGDVWLGTYDQGLAVLNRKTGTVRRFRHSTSDGQSLCNNSVFSLYEDRFGNVWIGTNAGLDEYDRRSGRLRHHDLSMFASTDRRWNVVNWLCEDSSGTLWCGTSTHLLKLNRSTMSFDNTLTLSKMFQIPIPPVITVITPQRDGTLWIGTLGGGMLKLRADGSVERRFVHEKNTPNSLSHNSVKTILIARDGDLWIGTEEGLNNYDPVHDQWRVYRTSNGLANDFIYGVLMDDNGQLWISTNKGLSRMNVNDADHPRIRNYTTDDGLQSYEFNTNVYFRASNGEMFFGGVNGFNSFYPDSVADNPHIPSVVFTGFKKFDQLFDLGGDVAQKKVVELRYTESVFSFEFSALEFTNQKHNHYAYRMEGVDRDWVYCGVRREARYTNLDPGEYVFRVKGSNNDGVWNETGASIRVTIVPPFWRTAWFLFVISVLGVGTLSGAIRFISTRKLRQKIEQLEREKAIQDERQRTRERIARDLHDDLASTVGSAGFFIETVKSQLKNIPEQTKEFLDKTSSLLTEAEESMSDIVWSVSPKHDTLESLLSRIRLTTADVCRANQMKYEVAFDENNAGLTLAEDVRRNAYLIFKEALANAVRHSGASLIKVGFTVCGDCFELSIADNGKGMPETAVSSTQTKRGHGLRNMAKRSQEVQAEFTLEPNAPSGTIAKLKGRMTQLGH
jgi:ligand-binding sensor domain-containing protein/signal transduction histidine kinase